MPRSRSVDVLSGLWMLSMAASSVGVDFSNGRNIRKSCERQAIFIRAQGLALAMWMFAGAPSSLKVDFTNGLQHLEVF